MSGGVIRNHLRRTWRRLPEFRLLALGLALESLWEVAQFPLYDVWHQSDWGYILYALAHCTLGDLLILLVAYEIVAVVKHDRAWYRHRPLGGAALFTLLGVLYTVGSEIYNVRMEQSWSYAELMPVLPVLGVGGMPFLQWLLIPPVLVWLLWLLGDMGRASDVAH